MNVFLTGGAGYIGSITTELLLDAGHRVTVFDNLSRGHRAAIDPRATFIHGDLRVAADVETAMRASKCDAVVHFAAYALVGESMQFPEIYFENNMGGGMNLVEAMRKTGVPKIIFSSTCATYGIPEKMPMTEDLPQRPENPYGESKLMFEKALIWYERLHHMRPVFLRYFNASGATEKHGEDHEPETHLIPNVLKVALGKTNAVHMFGDDYPTPDGTCIRDYIHIMDLAQAHILALEKDVRGPFNLGNGSGYSVKEVIDVARAVSGHPIPAKVSPRRPGDPPRLVAAATRAHEVLGWNPKYAALKTIVEHAWAWHKKHPNGYER